MGGCLLIRSSGCFCPPHVSAQARMFRTVFDHRKRRYVESPGEQKKRFELVANQRIEGRLEGQEEARLVYVASSGSLMCQRIPIFSSD